MTSQEDKRLTRDGVTLNNADALQLYNEWESPVVIVSDGAYGISGFAGDSPKAEKLPDWYEAHIEAWSKKATPQTTLWFWNRVLLRIVD
jgi:site-specific DNA-methyltransferase (adenine-specific)